MVDVVPVLETAFWRVYARQDFFDQNRTLINKLTIPHLDSLVTQLQRDFGFVVRLDSNQDKLIFVLDPNIGGAQTGTPFGVGIAIAEIAVTLVSHGIQGLNITVLSVHELINIMTGQITAGWVWADGSLVWRGQSPFPSAMDVVVLNELGETTEASIQKSVNVDPDLVATLLLNLQQQYGWPIFQYLFREIKNRSINLVGIAEPTTDNPSLPPQRTGVVLCLLSQAVGRSLIPDFQQVGINVPNDICSQVEPAIGPSPPYPSPQPSPPPSPTASIRLIVSPANAGTLTVTIEGQNLGTHGTLTITPKIGAVVTFTATTGTNYLFTGFTGPNRLSTPQNPFTVTITSDGFVQANFIPLFPQQQQQSIIPQSPQQAPQCAKSVSAAIFTASPTYDNFTRYCRVLVCGNNAYTMGTFSDNWVKQNRIPLVAVTRSCESQEWALSCSLQLVSGGDQAQAAIQRGECGGMSQVSNGTVQLIVNPPNSGKLTAFIGALESEHTFTQQTITARIGINVTFQAIPNEGWEFVNFTGPNNISIRGTCETFFLLDGRKPTGCQFTVPITDPTGFVQANFRQVSQSPPPTTGNFTISAPASATCDNIPVTVSVPIGLTGDTVIIRGRYPSGLLGYKQSFTLPASKVISTTVQMLSPTLCMTGTGIVSATWMNQTQTAYVALSPSTSMFQPPTLIPTARVYWFSPQEQSAKTVWFRGGIFATR